MIWMPATAKPKKRARKAPARWHFDFAGLDGSEEEDVGPGEDSGRSDQDHGDADDAAGDDADAVAPSAALLPPEFSAIGFLGFAFLWLCPNE